MITDLSGRCLDAVGGNGGALRDGGFEAAAFNRPPGLSYSAARDCLYVADTENNALREVCCPRGLLYHVTPYGTCSCLYWQLQ